MFGSLRWQMSLQAFQAGLSWTIVLRKARDIRDAFLGFDVPAVARMTDKDVERLLANG